MMYKKHKMLHKNKKLNPMGFVHEKRKGPLIWPKKSDSGHILAFVFKEFRPISEPSKKEADRYCYFGLFADQVVLYSLFPYCTEFWIIFFTEKHGECRYSSSRSLFVAPKYKFQIIESNKDMRLSFCKDQYITGGIFLQYWNCPHHDHRPMYNLINPNVQIQANTYLSNGILKTQ